MDGGLFVLLLLSGLFWSSSALSRPYFYINTPMSWPDAQRYCRERFTDLATVDNMDDVNRLVNIIDAGYSGSVWIGLMKGTQKQWSWSNGENTTSQYYNWASGQPDADGDCVVINSGFWHDMSCSNNRYFVCYKSDGYVFVKSDRNWTDARSHCRQYYTDLATIHSSVENKQITTQILTGTSFWLGLFLDSWGWSDQWDLSFRHWAAGQPSQTSGSNCVGMTRTESGRWSQYSCDVQQPFICYGGDSALSRPYFYINTAMSWPDAQSYCRERFTDLATVDNMDDVNRLVNITDAGYSGSVWIGLKKRTQTRWSWSNGENKNYYKWGSLQPNGDGVCAAIYYELWHDASCDLNLYFVCYEKSGYILVQSSKTWSDAQSYCRQYHTDLATIHSSEENDQINQILLLSNYIWIGLFLDSWGWSDQWDLSFRHWAAGQPSQASGSNCVGMTRTNSGRWSQYSCGLQQPFICYGDDIRKQIVRLKVTCKGKCALNDPSLQAAILNKISEKLKNMMLESESNIRWRKGGDGEVFHQENNHIVNLDRFLGLMNRAASSETEQQVNHLRVQDPVTPLK
ncbi:macrophage mannose receptor 1-like [Puntigrus tetrazona]|uniref:macrophage mannose receptor 1-like n=1 Tax=Puntigrus tetrazona TaxID=1606681 RepID=UPI001C8AE252|nr:macrophage mannose receptor 1-like [Puntigrus tetrazona]